MRKDDEVILQEEDDKRDAVMRRSIAALVEVISAKWCGPTHGPIMTPSGVPVLLGNSDLRDHAARITFTKEEK